MIQARRKWWAWLIADIVANMLGLNALFFGFANVQHTWWGLYVIINTFILLIVAVTGFAVLDEAGPAMFMKD